MVLEKRIALLAEILVHQLIGRIVETVGPLQLREGHDVLPGQLAIHDTLEVDELIVADVRQRERGGVQDDLVEYVVHIQQAHPALVLRGRQVELVQLDPDVRPAPLDGVHVLIEQHVPLDQRRRLGRWSRLLQGQDAGQHGIRQRREHMLLEQTLAQEHPRKLELAQEIVLKRKQAEGDLLRDAIQIGVAVKNV